MPPYRLLFWARFFVFGPEQLNLERDS